MQATDIFRSLDSGTVPLDWTLGSFVPIHKKGNKQESGNYRPVSLTSVVSKVLESLIRDRLLHHPTESNLLSNYQHGFRPGRSCKPSLPKSLTSGAGCWKSTARLTLCTLTSEKPSIRFHTAYFSTSSDVMESKASFSHGFGPS